MQDYAVIAALCTVPIALAVVVDLTVLRKRRKQQAVARRSKARDRKGVLPR